jgi:penicillin-insensitive murein endopeptidase
MRRRLAIAALFALFAANAHARDWSDVRQPTQGPTRSLGGPANGCIAGAAALPVDGPGYQAVRLSRNRIWGHPRTVAFVQRLAAEATAMGLPPLYIGDMSQPRGGPMKFGHASHQNGNDVDIWYNLDPKPDLPPNSREEIAIVRLVSPDEQSIERQSWRPEHAALLRAAALHREVDRIFVHFAIKRELCTSVTGDRSWLSKIRPWRGHDDHFHVRLSCPPGSGDCTPQSPVPTGDGCDATLDWWFADAIERRKALPPARTPPAPRPKLPAACAAVLEQR